MKPISAENSFLLDLNEVVYCSLFNYRDVSLGDIRGCTIIFRNGVKQELYFKSEESAKAAWNLIQEKWNAK